MPGLPLTGQGGQFGGPRYGWGEVPNQPGAGARSGSAGSRTNFNSGLNRGQYTSSPEAGLRRGEWQWRGHGPSAQQSYGWDYQGGVGRDEITQRTEARMGSSFQARMAQERSGGLPQGRYAVDYDRLGERTGRGGYAGDYGRGWEGRTGGRDRGLDRYGGDFRAGGGWTGSGSRRGGYGRDFQAGGMRDDFRGQGGEMRGGYGAQGYGGGMRGSMGGGYGRDYGQGPLSDADFYRRVERW